MMPMLAGLLLALPGATGLPAAARADEALIPLQEPSGQELLLRSRARADQGPLAQMFETQANLAYCGVASAVMVLNSLSVPAPAAAGYGSYRFWTQTNIFEDPRTLRLLQPSVVARQGMTLQELEGLLASHGLAVQRIHGDRLDLSSLRSLLRRSLNDADDRLLVNYDRRALGQAGGGHISPLAAYDEGSDRVLILDVARYRYPAVWVPTVALWRAMAGIDSSSGRSRGLVVIRRSPTGAPPAPASP